MEENRVHDVVIVGSGPAGYTAAIYTARAGLNPVVLAGAMAAGGALMNTTEVENFPGFAQGIMGPDLMDNMREQAERFGAEIIFEDATQLDLEGPVKTIHTDGAVYQAKTVILATGSEHRKIGLPEEPSYSGKGVSYCATCDGFFFKDRPIIVVGGGDSALQEAIFLSRFGSSVTVVHRRDELRASKVMQDRAFANENIRFEWNSKVTAINGESQVESVTLTDTQTGDTREVPASGVFVAIGHLPRTEILGGQLDLDENGYILVDQPGTKTSMPGVFASGDVVDHVYRQAITAAASGCRAALDVEAYLLENMS